MKNRIKTVLTATAVFLATASVSLAGTGVTSTEIHIGQWGPQTGPAAPWGSIVRGTDAYFTMINAEGGIHGRKIVYHYFDDAYNPAKTKAGVKQLQESDHGIFAWVGGVGTAPGLAVREYLTEKRIPWISPAAGSLAWVTPPSRYIFSTYPLYIAEAKSLVKYAVETLKHKRVAIVYQNDEYGKNGLRGFRTEMAKHGLKPVAAIPQNLMDKDLKPHVIKLMGSKAETVLLWTGPGGAARIVGTAKAMRYAPQWMASSTLSDYFLMSKITRGLWTGVITTAFAEPPESDHPLVKKYKADAFRKYAAKSERWGVFYLAGIAFAEPLVEGLRRTGRELTREKLVAVLEKVQGFKGIAGKIDFKPFDPDDIYSRQGNRSFYLAKCLKGGKTEKLTGWVPAEYRPGE